MNTPLKIVLTGGGSGGHITPILAIAAELKRLKPDSYLIYVGQTGDKLGDIPANDEHIDAVYTVRAGKFRRYNGEGWQQFLNIPTLLKNIRDAFYVLIGLYQSFRLLRRLKPNIVFVKGGFVGVPVGLAAAGLRIPYITHDSDAIPGLANRIIARWATLHTVALPAAVYHYPIAKTVTTGIPLQEKFVPVTPQLQVQYREQLGLPVDSLQVLVIGGGLGSQRVNTAVSEAVPHLLREYKKLYVSHGVGRGNETASQKIYDDKLTTEERQRIRVFGYEPDIYRYSGAADIIITRAGATNLAEFALQGKACIVIPSPFLSGGHQLKNAQFLEQQSAAVIISESDALADPNRLAKQVSELLKNPNKRLELAKQLSNLSKPNATQDLAKLIIDQVIN